MPPPVGAPAASLVQAASGRWRRLIIVCRACLLSFPMQCGAGLPLYTSLQPAVHLAGQSCLC